MIGWALSLSPICQLMWCWTRILKTWQNRALLWTSYPFAEPWGLNERRPSLAWRRASWWRGFMGVEKAGAAPMRTWVNSYTSTTRRGAASRRRNTSAPGCQAAELPARLVPVFRRALLLVTCSSLLLCKYACLLAHTLTRSLAHPLPLSDLLVYRQHSLLLVGVHCLFQHLLNYMLYLTVFFIWCCCDLT